MITTEQPPKERSHAALQPLLEVGEVVSGAGPHLAVDSRLDPAATEMGMVASGVEVEASDDPWSVEEVDSTTEAVIRTKLSKNKF